MFKFLFPIQFVFCALAFGQSPTNLNQLHYQSQRIDLRSLVGIGDFQLRAMVDERDDTLFWARNTQGQPEIFKISKKNEKWNEVKGETVFHLGKRYFDMPTFNKKRGTFFFLSDVQNNENINVYQFDPKANQVNQITHFGYSFAYDFGPKSNHLFTVSRATISLGQMCLDEMDVDSIRSRRILCDGRGITFSQWYGPRVSQREDKVAIVVDNYDQKGSLDLAIFNLKSPSLPEMITSHLTSSFHKAWPIGWKDDCFYFTLNGELSAAGLYASCSGITNKLLSLPSFNTRAFSHVSMNKIFLIEAKKGVTQVEVYNFKDHRIEKTIDAHRFKIVQNFGSQWLKDGRLVLPAQDLKTNHVVTLAIESKIDVIFDPTENSLMAPVCDHEAIDYETYDKDETGQKRLIHGILFKPTITQREVGNPAAIVYAHGGPAAEVGEERDLDIQGFCQAGYYVLAANVRGSTGHGSIFESLNTGDLGGGDYLDYEYARRYLTQTLKIPASRIGIAGGSYGGYMTNWALTRPKNEFAFGISLYGGVSDLYREVKESNVPQIFKSKMGDPDSNLDVFKLYFERAPINWAAQLNVPLLLFHGENDHRVPVTQSRDFYKKLKDLGRDATYIEFPAEGHYYNDMESFHIWYQEIYNFLMRVAPL